MLRGVGTLLRGTVRGGGRVAFPLYHRWLTARAGRKRLLAAGLPGGHWRERWALPTALAALVLGVIAQGAMAKPGNATGERSLLARINQGEGAAEIVEVARTAPRPVENRIAALGIGGTGGGGIDETDPAAADTPFSTVLSADGIPVGDSVEVRTGVVDYTIGGGDTVSLVAAKFGLGYKSILWANGIDDRSIIKPGMVLKIPPVDGVLYTVKSGENLTALVQKYQADLNRTLDVNRLPDASAIQVGQVVTLVGGQPPAPPAPPPSSRSQPRSPFFDVGVASSDQSGARGNRIAGAGYLWPTPNHRINQYFRGYYHTGIDIEGTYASPIYAAKDGVVSAVRFERYGYGFHIIISHGDGTQTLYGHASKIFVKTGQRVDRGQTIAMVGSTGRSTGTHLHFEIIIGGVKVNPLKYF